MDERVEAGVNWALAEHGPLDEEVAQALEGAVFPLSEADLAVLARENEAPSRVITLFSGLQPRTFSSLREVQDAVTAS